MAEDGRELYLQSVEFDHRKASEWVKEHVLFHLPLCPSLPSIPLPTIRKEGIGLREVLHHQGKANHGNGKCRHAFCPWRTREQITAEIFAFMGIEKYGIPELWGYYSAYDHVVFCQLFGTMMDLPAGWPMYTRDLKQWADQLGAPIPQQSVEGEHNALVDARYNQIIYLFLDGYEKAQVN